MSNGTKVVKRNGRIETLDLDKMHIMVDEACKGLAGVSASQVEMKSGIQFYDGISTNEIQQILIRSASDLIDLDHPNYQFVAARLLLFSVRKSLYGMIRDFPHLEQHIINCTNNDVYDNEPRNREIVNRISKCVSRGQSVVIWPSGIIEKDINDMVLSGLNVMDVLKSNTYSGLEAKIKFNNWKKI